jgi:hypothetical protein
VYACLAIVVTKDGVKSLEHRISVCLRQNGQAFDAAYFLAEEVNPLTGSVIT